MNKNYKYVISFLNKNSNSIEEINDFCLLNKNKIAFGYVHPPFGDDYADRHELDYSFTEENIQSLKDTMAIFKKYDIPIQVTFNISKFRHKNNDGVTKILLDMEKYISIFNRPEYIITFDYYAPIIKEHFPDIKLIRTINEIFTDNLNNLKYYDIIVLRGSDIYNFSLIKKIKDTYPNIKIEYLITDAGCVSTCTKRCDFCKDIFLKELDHIGINIMMALYYITTIEIDLLLENNYIDYLKIPPNNILMLQNTIDSQVKTYTKETLKASLYSDLDVLNNKYNFGDCVNTWKDNIDIDQILEIKNKIWSRGGITIDFKELIK